MLKIETFDEILEYVKKCGCSVQFDASEYYIQQVPEEFASLIFKLLKNGNYNNFMEIGSAAGGVSRIMYDFFNFKKMVIIDDNFQTKMVEVRKKMIVNLPVTELIYDSTDVKAIEAVDNLNIKFDILFIDGDHSYDGVKNDYINYLKFVENGGYLIFHDTISYPEVGRFVNELKEDNRVEFIDEFKNNYPVCGLALYKKK